MSDKTNASIGNAPEFTSEDTIALTAKVAAAAARSIFATKGCGNQLTANLVGAGAMAAAFQEYYKRFSIWVRVSEGRKDRHPRLPENQAITTPMTAEFDLAAIIDSIECEGQFVLAGNRFRASTSAIALLPDGYLAKLNSSLRCFSLSVPQGSPIGPDRINFHSSPKKNVRLLCDEFDCKPSEIHVTILNRPWTQSLIAQYRAAGTTVKLITAGDLQAMLEVARPVAPGGPVRICHSIGGTAEVFLAVPFFKVSGATLLAQQIPADMEMRLDQLSGPVYDKDSLIRTDDVLVAIAGLTEATVGDDTRFLVPGIRRSTTTGETWVSVQVASPLLRESRTYVAHFAGETLVELEWLGADFTVDEFIILDYLSRNELESRYSETYDRDYVQWRTLLVPGLETLSERDLLALLRDLEARRIVTAFETATPGDSSEYVVTWSR